MRMIPIADDVYQLLEQQAQVTQQTCEDILNDVMRRELSPYPREVARPTSELPASHHATEVALAQHNYTIFKQQLPELLEAHAGEYVALRHGQIMGFGRDKKALWHQIRDQYGPSGILVMEITETPRVVHISFNHVSRVH